MSKNGKNVDDQIRDLILSDLLQQARSAETATGRASALRTLADVTERMRKEDEADTTKMGYLDLDVPKEKLSEFSARIEKQLKELMEHLDRSARGMAVDPVLLDYEKDKKTVAGEIFKKLGTGKLRDYAAKRLQADGIKFLAEAVRLYCRARMKVGFKS